MHQPSPLMKILKNEREILNNKMTKKVYETVFSGGVGCVLWWWLGGEGLGTYFSH